MSARLRLNLASLLLLALLVVVVLIAFAGSSCAGDVPGVPCPEAGRNRAIVVALVGVATWLLVAPFAFLAEFALRRRIVYRGMWARAHRRGLLVGLAVAGLAGLRIGGALSVPGALFVVVMLVLLEWFAMRRVDQP